MTELARPSEDIERQLAARIRGYVRHLAVKPILSRHELGREGVYLFPPEVPPHQYPYLFAWVMTDDGDHPVKGRANGDLEEVDYLIGLTKTPEEYQVVGGSYATLAVAPEGNDRLVMLSILRIIVGQEMAVWYLMPWRTACFIFLMN